MPNCGSQVVLCDLPVRFDTYIGCGHGCTYCFAGRKRNMTAVKPGESAQALCDWIGGARTADTAWCNWRIPLHWGGLSDPFQPAEAVQGRSLECLRIFADSGYPVVISTKGLLIGTPEYLSVLKRCNAAVQVSMTSPRLDELEPGAPEFWARLRMLARLAKHVRRLIVRVQPYLPECTDVAGYLPRYADAGVHGVTVEALKSHKGAPWLRRLGADFVLPLDVLRPDFAALRARCHELGLRFYAAENRLRAMGDDTCCCGVADLPGWQVNRANLNRVVAGRPIRYTERMREPGTAAVFKALAQDPVSTVALRDMSYADAMGIVERVPVYRQIMGLDQPDGANCRPADSVRAGGSGAVAQAAARRGVACESPTSQTRLGVRRVLSTQRRESVRRQGAGPRRIAAPAPLSLAPIQHGGWDQ